MSEERNSIKSVSSGILISLFLSILVMCKPSQCSDSGQLITQGTTFLGTGYDLRFGNPQGRSIYEGGIDPGLKPSRSILIVNYTSISNPCPIQASCTAIDGKLRKSILVDDMESFNEELKRYWTFEEINYQSDQNPPFAGCGSRALTEVQELLENRKDVMITEEYSNIYADATLNYQSRMHLNPQFLAQLCNLGLDYNNATNEAFFNLFRNWGTHVIVYARLGDKVIQRNLYTEQQYMSYVMKYSPSIARPMVFNAESFLAVLSTSKDLNSAYVKYGLSESTVPYSKFNVEVGSRVSPIPLSMHLEDLSHFISKTYIDQTSGPCAHLLNDTIDNINEVVRTAMRDYFQVPDVQLQHSEVIRKIPLQWPAGTISLLKPTSDCPYFSDTGSRLQTSPPGKKASWSTDLPKYMNSTGFNTNPTLYFCSKTWNIEQQKGFYTTSWTNGSYCFFKKGNCPQGFQISQVHINDGNRPNQNLVTGILPDGSFGVDTIYHFCCRRDGLPTQPLLLPTASPFFLFPLSETCQQVAGMKAELHWFAWAAENGWSEFRGTIKPYGKVMPDYSVKLYMCSYTPII